MFFVFTLKGESFKVRDDNKIEHRRYIKLLNELEAMKIQQKKKMDEIKQTRIDMLDARQKIIFENPVPKNITSEQMLTNKKYLKRQELLKAYDLEHGEYIE